MTADTDELFYVGLNWAAETHAVCIINATGKTLANFTVEHTAEGLIALKRRLGRYGDPDRVQVGIERPGGRLVAATIQLAAFSDNHWLGAKAIFADIESAIALAFLTRYATPASADRLGEKRLAAFPVKNGYSGRRSAAKLLTRIRAAPAGTTDPILTEALRDAVLAMTAVLTGIGSTVKKLDRSVAAHLGEHPDGPIFTSLPRSGQINAAQVLAEWGDVRPAYDSPAAIAALAGITRVTKASGSSSGRHGRPPTVAAVQAILASRKIVEQSYRSCLGMMPLAEKAR